jgi:hypothetical protein
LVLLMDFKPIRYYETTYKGRRSRQVFAVDRALI